MGRPAARLGQLFASTIRARPKPSTATVLRASISASGVAAATAAMVAYTSVVSKAELAADVPEEARLASHHVKGSHGQTVKFKNPHPSGGGDISIAQMLGKILW
jgi:hypothetical protein